MWFGSFVVFGIAARRRLVGSLVDSDANRRWGLRKFAIACGCVAVALALIALPINRVNQAREKKETERLVNESFAASAKKYRESSEATKGDAEPPRQTKQLTRNAAPRPGRTDKISTLDFRELRRGARMSEVIAAVGEPSTIEKDAHPQTMIEWYYRKVPSASTSGTSLVILYFNKSTERLEHMQEF